MQRYRRVTYETRCHIRAFLDTQFSVREIAKRLGVHRSTIYRELKRNSQSGVYAVEAATELAAIRFARCRKARILKNPEVATAVHEGLSKDWSPEQIAGRVKGLSRQTIYNEIRRYRADWKIKLRRHGKTRGRGRWKRRTNAPVWEKSIHTRPSEVNRRQVFGHWERDTLYTKQRKQMILLIERMSRYVKIAKVEDFLTEQTKELLRETKAPVHSLTNDRGNEFLDGYLFRIPVYYCDPRSPQQKGSVENAIGLLRQYIPKKADLDQLTEEDLRVIEDKLNNRPRKCLDYKTPAEVFKEQLVALAI